EHAGARWGEAIHLKPIDQIEAEGNDEADVCLRSRRDPSPGHAGLADPRDEARRSPVGHPVARYGSYRALPERGRDPAGKEKGEEDDFRRDWKGPWGPRTRNREGSA